MRLTTELKELTKSVRDMSEQRDILLTSIEELKKKMELSTKDLQ